MRNSFIRNTISASAMLALVSVGGLASADEHDHGTAERAGASVDRAGSKVKGATKRTGNRMENAADRTGNRMENAADRTGNRMDRSGERAEERAEDRAEAYEERAEEAGDNTGVAAEISDTWITTKVKSSFIGEDALDGSDISVDTESDGVVTLTGTVRNKVAKRRAEVVAKDVEGVKKVKNELKVVSTRNVSGRDRK